MNIKVAAFTVSEKSINLKYYLLQNIQAAHSRSEPIKRMIFSNKQQTER